MKRNSVTRKRGTSSTRVNLRYIKERYARFLENIRSIHTPLTASVDESSIMLKMAPYGWAPRGQCAAIPQSSLRTVSYSLLLCVCPVGVLSWTLRIGTIDSIIFPDFLGKLPDGVTLLLDNARSHHATRCLMDKVLSTVAELAQSKSIRLEYTISPYERGWLDTKENTNKVHDCKQFEHPRSRALGLRKAVQIRDSLFLRPKPTKPTQPLLRKNLSQHEKGKPFLPA